MKQLILIIALIAGFNCYGQKKDSLVIKGDISATRFIGGIDIGVLVTGWAIPSDRHSNFYITPKQDTIRALMLVCDTSVSGSIGKAEMIIDCVWWQFGYVTKGAAGYEDVGSAAIYMEKTFYLDQNKKPLPKSIVVWMTKEIK